MTQSLNQFNQTAERGQIALRGEGNNLISVVVDSAEAGVIKAGDLVVLSGSNGGIPTVKKAAGTAGEVILGFAVYNVIQNEFKAGMLLEIALTSVCMTMEASAAIAAGKSVAYAAATGLVQEAPSAAAAATPVVGVALTKATAAKDLIVVYIKTL